MKTVVTRDTIAAYILLTMNEGTVDCGENCVHRNYDRDFSTAYAGARANRSDLEILAGSYDWETYEAAEAGTADQIREITGVSDFSPRTGAYALGDKFIVIVGDNGMDDFYFLFRRIEY
jgi:hypothetical protein